MQNDNTYAGIVVTLIIVLVFLGAISLLFWATRRYLRPFFWYAPPPSRMAARPGSTPPWIWLFLILGFSLTFWQFVPKAEKRDRPQPARAISSYTPLLLTGGIVALAGAFLAYGFIRAYDFGIRRAEKRANAGDINGAIADLREQIDDKGPTQLRVNALGVLRLPRCDRWDEAAESFRKAAELDGPKGICWSNLGLALLRGGKPEEALRVLRDAAQIGPRVPALLCMVGSTSDLA